MGGYTAKLARRIKEQGAGGSSPLILAEYVSPSAIRIGGEQIGRASCRERG